MANPLATLFSTPTSPWRKSPLAGPDPTVLAGLQARTDTNPALQLADLQQQRLAEAQTTQPPNADIAGLQADLAGAPETGTAAHAAVAYNAPDAVARRQADEASALKKLLLPEQTKGDYALRERQLANEGALATTRAQSDAALALDRQKQEQQQQNNDKLLQLFGGGGGGGTGMGGGGTTPVVGMKPSIDAQGRVSYAPILGKPMGQLEQRAVTSFAEAQPILDALEKTLRPGDNQALSYAKNALGSAAYHARISTDPLEQSKIGLAGLLTVLGSSPYVVGSRSYQMIKQAMEHLTASGPAGPGSDAFIQHQIDTIRALWPRMQQEVVAAHQQEGGADLNQGATLGASLGANW